MLCKHLNTVPFHRLLSSPYTWAVIVLGGDYATGSKSVFFRSIHWNPICGPFHESKIQTEKHGVQRHSAKPPTLEHPFTHTPCRRLKNARAAWLGVNVLRQETANARSTPCSRVAWMFQSGERRRIWNTPVISLRMCLRDACRRTDSLPLRAFYISPYLTQRGKRVN